MTSRISYSKLSRENRKRMLGMTIVTVLTFFIKAVFLVMGVNECSSHAEVLRLFRPNMGMAGAIIGLAACSAAGGLYYLHSRKQTDFYESLPIKRATLFRLVVQNSLFIFLIPLVIEEAIEFVIAQQQISGGGWEIVSSSLWYLLIFAATWLTMALAMIMTGNIIVGILGFGVFASYFPIVIYNIFPLYAGSFFATYSGNTADNVYNNITNYLSPVWVGLRGMADINSGRETQIKYMMILLLWIVGLYVLCRTLYNRRPAESAGRAMAFTKANTVIKVLLVIPSALYSGIIFYSLGNASSIFWLIFGVVFGVFVIHALIECIYEFDVRAIFCHKKQLIVIMLGSLFIMASFSADLFGYDRYIPKASSVESIEIKPSEVNSYGYWGKGEEREGLKGEEKQLALSVIKESVEVKNSAATSSSGYYEKNSKFLFFASVSKKEVMSGDIEISTTFCMKNGNRKVRNYTLRSQKAKELYNKLYATREFKKNIYALYTGNYNDIQEITWSGIETEYLNLTKEEKKQFFDTYLSELDGLSYTDVQKTVPVGNIDISIGGTMGSENATQDTYYIYPSFKKTLAFLAQKGCAVNQTIDNLNISSIWFEGYDENTGENIRYRITDKKRINKVKGKLVLQQMVNVPGITVINGSMDIQVNYKNKNGGNNIYCYSICTDDELQQLLKE